MEESKSEEPFLKIETIWSESKEKFESMTVKEENISDAEPEITVQQPDDNYDSSAGVESGKKISLTNNSDIRDITEDGVRDLRGDINKKGNVEGETICSHEAKNYKIIKGRLRCCDCKSILCPECYCTVTSSLQTHFSKSDNYNKNWYHCKLCSMIFKSNCALQAHTRIHLLDTPYVCPDCGAIYNNLYFLSLHLINKCYHVYKVIVNGCKFCVSGNMAPEDYLSHIKEFHIKPVYKCSQCGTVHESKTDINRHMAISHKNKNVLCLNYFSCSMCGDLIISKHLYEKHIIYHQVHSTSFQIGYLCSCGRSFNTANSFRIHFKDCSKKGILPPQWTYLQVTLKTQEMLQVQSAIQKSNILQSDSSLNCNSTESSSEIGFEKGKMDYSLFEDGDSSEELEEVNSEGNSGNITNSSEVGKTKNSERNKGKGQDAGAMHPVRNPTTNKTGPRILGGAVRSDRMKGKSVSEDQAASSIGFAQKISDNTENSGSSSNASSHLSAGDNAVETISGDEEVITDKSGAPNVQLFEELSVESVDESINQGHCEKGKEPCEKVAVRVGDKSLKVVYDHIPCDHLGYLKIQQGVDQQNKNWRKERSEIARDLIDSGILPSAESYQITSVLDEKTGLMRAKKVLIQKSPSESLVDITSIAVGERIDCSEIFPNVHFRELNKAKNSTFFTCPFCAVLFPKHFSSFQRFRLHLECHHPEAALDITVNRTQIPKSQTQFTSITISDEVDSDDSYDLDDVDLQTRLNSWRESNKDSEAGRRSNSRSVMSNDGISGNGRRRRVESHFGKGEKRESEAKARGGKGFEEKESENSAGKSEKSGARSLRKDSSSRRTNEDCAVVADLESNDSMDANFANFESREGGRNALRKEAGFSSAVRSNSVEDLDEQSESVDSEFSLNLSRTARSKNDDDNPRRRKSSIEGDTRQRKKMTGLEEKIGLTSEESLSNDKSLNESREASNDSHEVEMSRQQDGFASESCSPTGEGSDSKGLHTDDYVSVVSQGLNFVKTEGSQSVKEEGAARGRSSERRNSRRESDVWSEFYKTLKIAETFKKTKMRNQEKEGSEESSILTNYANKRVVKKPKRYRESSDSEDSLEEGKQFGGESKNFDSLLEPEDEDMYIKKRKLLNSLENVDYRILNYVFKLIERKQKSYGVGKRTGEGSLRNCKKRIANGVRGPGKQLATKVGLENDEDTQDNSTNSFDRENFETNGDDADWDGQAATSSEDKPGGDKKRGRPRKGEPLAVKERRRSDLDREVNFIEKNFEADEGDFFTNKRKRKLSSKLQYYKKVAAGPAEKNDFSSGQVISTKTLEAERKLSCAVCKESCQSEAEFREHILVHRVDENNHQCMECGECFVVRPSLEKHLHAFHKIKDVQKYIEENECSTVEKPEEPESEPLKENQCKVCKDQFANVHDLNKHFRIHGMAFLRQYKKDNKPNQV